VTQFTSQFIPDMKVHVVARWDTTTAVIQAVAFHRNCTAGNDLRSSMKNNASLYVTEHPLSALVRCPVDYTCRFTSVHVRVQMFG